jgi:hypothetical protein
MEVSVASGTDRALPLGAEISANFLLYEDDAGTGEHRGKTSRASDTNPSPAMDFGIDFLFFGD